MIMKSTKVQNPRHILLHALRTLSLVNYANARARKLATPRVVAVTRGAVVSSRSSLVTSRPTHKGKGRLVNIERFLGRRPRAAALMGQLVTRLYPLPNYNMHVRETECTWL